VRDPAYDLVARNRYRWFGHRPSCHLPTPQTRDRFIDL
jgi:predicted DCC family thiol-disulfide oxidoreductase YuxK